MVSLRPAFAVLFATLLVGARSAARDDNSASDGGELSVKVHPKLMAVYKSYMQLAKINELSGHRRKAAHFRSLAKEASGH
jgi:hypothetical protein